MKIMLITWYFPPINDVAALRTGALAKFLVEHGHEVHVVTAQRNSVDQSLAVPLPPEQVERTSWFDMDRLKYHSQDMATAGQSTAPLRATPKATASGSQFGQLRAAAATTFANFFQIPDRQVGWISSARAAGRELARRHSFDLIYASGPPFSTHLVASSLAHELSVPWIGEYRDGWSGDFYSPRPKWRQAIDRLIEARTVATAAGIVAATQPWADYYRNRYAKPTAAIYNGFDVLDTAMQERTSNVSAPVTIAYFGVLYNGLRDPSLLYEGIRRSGLEPTDIQVTYYGPSEGEVTEVADKFGVRKFVAVRRRVAYEESLRIQRESDVLLLLQAPGDPRNVPAKLFEYLASQRPILGLGLDAGVPATMIRQRAAGTYVSDVDAIARQLVGWVGEKRRTGYISDTPASARAGLSRVEQFEELDRFLSEAKKSRH